MKYIDEPRDCDKKDNSLCPYIIGYKADKIITFCIIENIKHVGEEKCKSKYENGIFSLKYCDLKLKSLSFIGCLFIKNLNIKNLNEFT